MAIKKNGLSEDHAQYIATRDSYSAIEKVEPKLFAEMLFFASSALNDLRAIERVAKEFGVSKAYIEAFNGMLMDIAHIEQGESPSISRRSDLEAEKLNLEINC